jgi:acetyl esterase/lipase
MLPLGLLVGALAVGAQLVRRRRLIAAAAPELRSWQLFLPIGLVDRRSLPVGRRFLDRPTACAPGVTCREVDVVSAGGRRVRTLIYDVAARRRPSGAVLWIHGGGYVMGIAEMSNDWCSRMARELDVLVANVDYRLAPEHPFPAGLDDCYAVLEWLHREAEALGVDPARIAVAGASAGGGMAAALAQMAHDRGGPPVCFQLLEYPMLDDRSGRTDAPVDTLVWNRRSNAYAWGAYLTADTADAAEQRWAVPARRADLSGLPPAWVGVGDIDLFHGEDVEYARRLREAGVACELHVEPGMYHAADVLAPDSAAMRAFTAQMIDALRRGLAGTPAAGAG